MKYSEPLGRHTTFRIGGPAAIHFQPATAEATAGAIAWAKQHKVPWLVLGLGSNVLIRDGGFPGLVVKIAKGLDAVSHRAGTWKVGAGLPVPLLARKTAEEGFAGIHRLIGVPGSVGRRRVHERGCPRPELRRRAHLGDACSTRRGS